MEQSWASLRPPRCALCPGVDSANPIFDSTEKSSLAAAWRGSLGHQSPLLLTLALDFFAVGLEVGRCRYWLRHFVVFSGESFLTSSNTFTAW